MMYQIGDFYEGKLIIAVTTGSMMMRHPVEEVSTVTLWGKRRPCSHPISELEMLMQFEVQQ